MLHVQGPNLKLCRKLFGAHIYGPHRRVIIQWIERQWYPYMPGLSQEISKYYWNG